MTHRAPISRTHHETLNSRQVPLHTKNFMFLRLWFQSLFPTKQVHFFTEQVCNDIVHHCESTYEMFDRHATRSEGGIPVFRFLLSVLLEK